MALEHRCPAMEPCRCGEGRVDWTAAGKGAAALRMGGWRQTSRMRNGGLRPDSEHRSHAKMTLQKIATAPAGRLNRREGSRQGTGKEEFSINYKKYVGFKGPTRSVKEFATPTRRLEFDPSNKGGRRDLSAQVVLCLVWKACTHSHTSYTHHTPCTHNIPYTHTVYNTHTYTTHHTHTLHTTHTPYAHIHHTHTAYNTHNIHTPHTQNIHA